MKVTHIMHAAILVETQGLRILSDPWWRGPCFGAQWWNCGTPYLEAVERADIDYVYISHGHHDHYHIGTLKLLNKSAKMLVSNQLDLADSLRAEGFTVIELEPDQDYDLGVGVSVRIIPTCNDDTLMVINDGNQVCMNLNDALHSAPRDVQDRFVSLLNRNWPTADYLFCGFGTASHFPNCYRIPDKDYVHSAILRQQYFNRQWVYLVESLKPKFAFPFAADVLFLEDNLRWVNEPVHNGERPTDVFKSANPGSKTKVYDIAPGFSVQDGEVVDEVLRSPIDNEKLAEQRASDIARANQYPEVTLEQVEEVAKILKENIEKHRVYFASWEGDYKFAIFFRSYAGVIVIEKQGIGSVQVQVYESKKSIQDAQVTLTTRLSYLNWSLTKKYGSEIIFVGSGGIFEYQDKALIKNNVHNELKSMITGFQPVRPARVNQPGWLLALKSVVKALLGRKEAVDLYALKDWTIFKN